MDFFPGFIMFLGFVPLLYLEEYFFQENNKYVPIIFFLYCWLSFAVWNLFSFWWAWQPSIYGLIAPVVINSFLYALVLFLWHLIRLKSVGKINFSAFVILFLGFEYLHHNWDLSFPWLTLGNNFSKEIYAIQWYEYTGVLGGSLWILLINILIFQIIKSYKRKEIFVKKIFFLLFLIMFPLSISIIIYYYYSENQRTKNVLIIQPNIDPYTEKFEKLTVEKQLEKMIFQAQKEDLSSVDFLIFPETAISEFFKESNIEKSSKLTILNNFKNEFPNIKIVIGAMTYKQFFENEEIPKSAIKIPNTDFYYDYYNSAVFLTANEDFQIYHKSKLLMGAERMPFQNVLSFLKKINFDISGGVNWYGIQENASVFDVYKDSVKIAPIICWESVYGDYIADFVGIGANTIFVITNDGWWGNTNGHKQHLRISQIRAIETRRYIARCANTGISAFINQKGQIIDKTEYWTNDNLRGEIILNSKLTFYVKYGNIIGKIAGILSIILLIYLFFKIIKGKFTKSFVKY